ncbi:DUF4334 domain-containing protein [Mycobacterium sp. 21AC1]|uniref:DUF4334 domain-containing protein n=1 Tax=[Mycobacterium] appelbergii TaxID=2939269 RepID=UPI0029394FEB|nr:DUF4334 domain-containing protein [Mycobacterium sp. 21AC1]MDV3125169.1 DUF4334 domain-containing protein [Mycobacterium sp. 21AC1]
MLLQELLPDPPSNTAGALELFDASAPVDPEFMIGTWQGAELPTGHPMDGLLAASGWWGKQFVDTETVHPLLFPARDGASLWALNPLPAFGGLGVSTRLPGLRTLSVARPITALRPLLQARSAKARLRTTRYRGVDTATMIYDQLPINDVFHRLSDDAVIGAMDLRGSRRPYFFVLRRNDSMPVA